MKKIISFLIIVISLFILICFDSILINKKGGLVGLFHLNDDVTTQEIEKLKDSIWINEKENQEIKLYLGENLQLTISDNLGNTSLNAWNFTFMTTDVNVASVSSTGQLIAKKVGNTSLKVTNKNDCNLYDIVSVTVENKSDTLKIVKSSGISDAMILKEIKRLDVITGGCISRDELEYVSSNPDIVEIKDSYLYAKGIGSAVITVSSKINKSFSDSVEITVKDDFIRLVPTTRININHLFVNKKEVTLDSLTLTPLKVGDELIINAGGNSSKLSQVVVTCLTPNITLISQDDYTSEIKATKKGLGVIKISSKYNDLVNKVISFRITDEESIINEFNVTSPISNETFKIGEISKLIATSNKGLIKNKDIEVAIFDEDIIKYESGYFIPLKAGKTSVTFTYLYDETKKISFDLGVSTDLAYTTAVDHIAINNVLLNDLPYNNIIYLENILQISDKFSFEVDITPFNATYFNDFLVISDNPDAVDIEQRFENKKFYINLKFKQNGNIKIFLISPSNLDETKTLKFNIGNIDNYFDFEINTKNSYTAGKSYKLLVTKKGTNDKNQLYSYSSSNPDILSIGPNGDLIAFDSGEVTISVSTKVLDKIITKQKLVKIEKEYKEYLRVTEMNVNTYIKENNNLIPIDFNESFLNVYQKSYLTVSVSPNYNNANNYTVTSLNPAIISIVYIDNMYTLIPLSSGEATIKITNYEDQSLSKELNIKVCDVLPKYFIPKIESTKLFIGTNEAIDFLIDSNATYTKPKISFSTPNVVRFEDNTIISENIGNTTLIISIEKDGSTYKLTLPIEVLPKEFSKLSDFNKIEVITFITSHILIYFVFGIYIYLAVKECKLKKNLSILVLTISTSLMILIPELIKIRQQSITLILISLLISVLSVSLGITISIIIKRRKISDEKNI